MHNMHITVEPRFTLTSVIQLPRNYDQSKIISITVKYRTISPANTVTSLFRSVWSSPKGDINNKVQLYIIIFINI